MRIRWRRAVAGCLAACLLLKLMAGPVWGKTATSGFLRTITFTVFGEPGRNWDDIYFSVDGEAFEPVRFNPYGRSEKISAAVGQEMHFYRSLEAADLGASPAYRPLASLALSSGVTDFLFLFISQRSHSNRDGSEGVAVFALDDGRRAIPADHLTFFNATGLPLHGSINDSAVHLGLGQSRPIRIDPEGGAVALALSVVHEGASHPVLINRLRFSSSRRTLLLLLPPRRAGSLRIQSFRISELSPEINL